MTSLAALLILPSLGKRSVRDGIEFEAGLGGFVECVNRDGNLKVEDRARAVEHIGGHEGSLWDSLEVEPLRVLDLFQCQTLLGVNSQQACNSPIYQ